MLKELEAELSTLGECLADGHTKRVCHLRAGRRDGKYLRLSRSGQPVIDQARVREHARLDGKLVVHSNDDAPNAEDTALGYKQLQRVEEAWRTLQSGLRLRPVYHYAPPLHPCARFPDRSGTVAGTDCRTSLRGYLAYQSDRVEGDKAGAIVEPERYRL